MTFTLLIGVMILGVVLALMWSALKMYKSTLEIAQGRQAATLFFEQLESDLGACAVLAGRRRDPVAISPDGTRLAFYRADERASTLQVTIAVPVEYSLAGRDAPRHPVRNGEVRGSVYVDTVHYELVRPDRKERRNTWLLRVDATFPSDGRRVLRVVRLIELVQPTTALAEANFVSEVPLGSFVFKPGRRETLDLLETVGLGPGVSGELPAAVREAL